MSAGAADGGPLELCAGVVALADGRCAYAEARHVALDEERLAARGGHVDEAAPLLRVDDRPARARARASCWRRTPSGA